MKTGIKVCDVMTKKPIVVSPDDNLKDCAKKMLRQRVGSLIVKEGDKLVGIVTEKDFVNKVVADGKDPSKTKVQDIMKKRVTTISPEVDIYDALVKMNKERVRRLPVTVDSNVIGLLTLRDILSVQPQLFENFTEILDIKKHEKDSAETKHGICNNCKSLTEVYKTKKGWFCEVCKD